MLQRDLLATEIRTYADEADRLTAWVGASVGRRTAESLYKDFLNDGQDGHANAALVHSWEASTPADKLKMLTARLAELAALDYFRFDKPKDVSLTQALNDPEQDGWKTHDIFLEKGGVYVDVKSARRPNWLPARAEGVLPYREFLVPKLKRERELQQHVHVAGVLSPHLDAADFGLRGLEPAEEWYPHRKFRPSRRHRELPKDFIVLGTTSKPKIEALKKRFTRGAFAVELITTHRGGVMLPPWVFTHHPRVPHRLRGALEEFVRATDRFPAEERLPVYPVPYYLAARRPLNDRLNWYLSPWQQQLYEMLLKVEHDLPHLHLALLSHFVWAARRNLPDFEPHEYDLLFFRDQRGAPVGVPDPLNLLRGLIRTLQSAWEHREQIDFGAYDSFHYRGLGILRGIRGGEERTLLAYCRDCATAPLIAGQDEHCDDCHHLACPSCGACGYECPAGVERKARIRQQREERRREEAARRQAQRDALMNPFADDRPF